MIISAMRTVAQTDCSFRKLQLFRIILSSKHSEKSCGCSVPIGLISTGLALAATMESQRKAVMGWN